MHKRVYADKVIAVCCVLVDMIPNVIVPERQSNRVVLPPTHLKRSRSPSQTFLLMGLYPDLTQIPSLAISLTRHSLSNKPTKKEKLTEERFFPPCPPSPRLPPFPDSGTGSKGGIERGGERERERERDRERGKKKHNLSMYYQERQTL